MNRKNILVIVGLGLLFLTLPVNAEILTPLTTSDDWKVIDIGAPYTEAHMNRVGGIAFAEQLNCGYIAGINTATAASRMKVIARLVGQKMIPTSVYTEPDDLLEIWHAMVDGDTASVGPFAGLRDLWGADILLASASQGGGRGGGAFAVVGSSRIDTAAHEWGHCLGMNHSIEDPQTPKCDPNDQDCLRSHGFVGYTPEGEKFCDLLGMGCEANTERKLCFANPSVLYKGQPFGKVGEAEAALVGERNAVYAKDWKPSGSPSLCAPDPGSVYLLGGRFQLINHVKRPLSEGRATAVKLSDSKVKFTYENLKPTVVTLSCSAGKLTVKVTGQLPKAVMRSLLVLDTETGRNKSFIKPAGTAFKPATDSTTFACN